MPVILLGAEPFSADGGPHGVLCLHGFTGNPFSMRPLAQAFAAAGYTVELPRLPGHGTTVEDMITTTWSDWSDAAEAVYEDLASRCERVVVAGLSMGGTLTVWLATRHPELAGIVCINPAVKADPAMAQFVDEAIAAGETVLPSIGSDIAMPGVTELSYDATPLAPLRSLLQGDEDLQPRLADIRCPVLLFTSPNDHVVPPDNSDHLAASVSGPVERVTLERSFHVATLDFDAGLIESRAIAFAGEVCAAS